MIISIDTGKVFHTIQHSFIINILPKMGMEGTYLNIIKATQDQPTANTLVNSDMLIAFLLKCGRKKGLPAPLLFNMGLEVLPTTIRQEPEMKGIQTGSNRYGCHGMQIT